MRATKIKDVLCKTACMDSDGGDVFHASTNCTFNATYPVIAGVDVAILPDCHSLS
jgi:hypothetical protein